MKFIVVLLIAIVQANAWNQPERRRPEYSVQPLRVPQNERPYVSDRLRPAPEVPRVQQRPEWNFLEQNRVVDRPQVASERRPGVVGPREEDRSRPQGSRDGDRPRPQGPRDGDRPQVASERRPGVVGPREEDRSRPQGSRDGDRQQVGSERRPGVVGPREEDRSRPQGPRDGDRPQVGSERRPGVEGPRPGDRPQAGSERRPGVEGRPRPQGDYIGRNEQVYRPQVIRDERPQVQNEEEIETKAI